MTLRFRAGALLAAAGLFSPAPAQAPVVVKKINQSGAERGSNPSRFVPLGGGVVFAADRFDVGPELFYVPAVGQPAVLLKDIRPGFAGSDPLWLTAVGSECEGDPLLLVSLLELLDDVAPLATSRQMRLGHRRTQQSATSK